MKATLNINLTPELREYIRGKIKRGDYQTESEVVREALRFRRQSERDDYLNPPPLTKRELAKLYGPNPEKDAREHRLVRASVKKPEDRE
jgi:Arc/MetJ-type ribon-helix-helix transcriptional regulator